MELRDIIVLTPSGGADPSLAIAANRAGAIGVLDLEFTTFEDPTLSESIARISRFAHGAFGVKLRSENWTTFKQMVGSNSIGNRLPARVVLAGPDTADLKDCISELRASNIEVLRETVSLNEAVRAVGFGVDGIILKGQEAGGRVGSETAFLLIQQWRQHADKSNLNVPFWVQGGIGPFTAAACLAAGARGVVLDSQLLLTRESPLSEASRKRITSLDGSESLVLGTKLGEAYRVYSRPDSSAAINLAKIEEQLLNSDQSSESRCAAWREAVRSHIALDPTLGAWLVGQDIAQAANLASTGVTVAGILQSVCQKANSLLAAAQQTRHLAEGSPFAKSHGTQYPILQGPMTRVSDTAAFANAVAIGGAVPFLALALLRKAETEHLLNETQTKLGSKPWGVGILGFVPAEIRAEQLQAIRQSKPPFAIIAGGRPDQAKELESQGIPTYLHVPSPGLLKMFLKDGATRFIFEGQECGGHIGPRTSFALWETMIAVLMEHIGQKPAEQLHVVFAGGIHDALSAKMVAALSASLAEKGVKVGVLLGTAYLFTREAVEAGAITAAFQKEALACGETVLLESGPGHAIRCIPTPYAATFESEKQKLRSEGKSQLDVGIALERMNLGRLRLASKGVDRKQTAHAENGAAQPGANGTSLVTVPDDEQVQRGMYMIGQVATLRDKITTIAELHADISKVAVKSGGNALPDLAATHAAEELPAPPPCDVAIIGLSCFYPKSNGLWNYWDNILAKVNAVVEIPDSHWDWRLYYDPDPRAKDKMVSKWGGFIDDVSFDPLKYGITPKSIPNIEPLQLLLLEAVNQALGDAGYLDRPFNRERTCAILGVGGGGMPLSVSYGFRACMPLMDTIPGLHSKSTDVIMQGEGILPEWTEDSFPGILLNVAAGRVANRFNLGGPNMAIDAACGSSLAALYAGVRELNDGTSDVAIVMGGDMVQTPYAYVAFSKTHALSPRGRCRPFDAAADGIALAEGVGVAVLKRLADAERDGDRIYSVIKGVGASSDGRDKGLTAPRAEGQLRALHRAYAQARVSPAHVGLVEAHGTGTVVGDQTEARAIGQLLREAGGRTQSCAIGSVKSMIGHSKCAAGLAGLIKTAFALHHKMLPPTLVEMPNPKANLDGGPLYLNTETRPWVHGADHPRTAGVSAFGFGGTNFHTVLEEYTGDYLNRPSSGMRRWPAELFVWTRPDISTLTADVKKCRDSLQAGASPQLADLAASVCQSAKRIGNSQPTLAIIATSLEDLRQKLDTSLDVIAKPATTHADPRGVYFVATPADATGTVAFLFPGQGSQYPDMLAQQAMAFSEVRETLDQAEKGLIGKFDKPLGQFIYPPSAFTPEQDAALRADLQRTDVAQPAIGAASLGMFRLLTELGVGADFYAGHSYGEYVALAAAGAISNEDLYRLSYQRGHFIRKAADDHAGGMIAADASPQALEPLLKGLSGVWLANHNAPNQSVLAGTEAGLKDVGEKLKAAGIRAQRIAVACGFHSPLINAAAEPLATALQSTQFFALRKPVFSNTTAAPYASNPAEIVSQLSKHLTSQVRFVDQVAAMHTAGARVFLEVGPQAVLTGLVGRILEGKPHVAVASDVKARPGLIQLLHLVGQLVTSGVAVKVDRLFQGREVQPFELNSLNSETGKPKHSPTTWVINGVRSRPINGPEPRLLGQRQSFENASPTHSGSTPVDGGTRPTVAAPTVAAPSNLRLAQAQAPKPIATSATRTAASLPAPSVSRQAKMNNNITPLVNPVASAKADSGQPQPPNALPDDAAAVMMRFQDVMAKFLDTQRSVMLGFLGASPEQKSGHSGNSALPFLPNGNGHTHANGNGHVAHIAQSAPAPVAPAINRLAPSAALERVAPPVARVQEVVIAVPAATPKIETQPAALAIALDRDTILARLLDLVSERTGYPQEALSIDLDLEADLGVDSIKRVEILGTLAESIGAAADGNQPNLEMEKLSTIKTLRGIADYVTEALAGSETEPQATGTSAPQLLPAVEPTGDLHPGARKGEIQRLVVRLVDAPLSPRPRFTPPSGTILITDDGRGTAHELADRLAELDIKTALIRMASDHSAQQGGYSTDLTDPDSVQKLLVNIRNTYGSVSGLIHLLPLAEPVKGETPEQQTRREVTSLYLLARGLEAEIRKSGTQGSAALLAVTAMGGRMGFGGELPDTFFAGHGGVAGFTKCLGYEWPEVTVRVIDVDGETPASHLAELLFRELGEREGPFEVGHDGNRRVTWQVEPGPLVKDQPAIELGPDSTVLITGGARGITAKIAIELATRYQPRLVLVGSSAAPEQESAETAGLTSQSEIKTALLRKQPEAKPAVIEATYKRLLKNREMRANIDAIRQAGSRVEYRSLDVRDEVAFGQLIEELNAAGGIAGVIHGAGVIEDKLLKDKTPESFDRVFSTKVDSALTLARKLDPSQLKFLALYASITSRYGNRGQSDYAAANEVLSKLACDLDRRWPGRVVSVAWGPWAEVGMVADLEKHLVARGLKLIEPRVGAGFAVDEVIYGAKGEPEVLVAGGTESPARPVANATTSELATAGVK